jgi:hypothetical protein
MCKDYMYLLDGECFASPDVCGNGGLIAYGTSRTGRACIADAGICSIELGCRPPEALGSCIRSTVKGTTTTTKTTTTDTSTSFTSTTFAAGPLPDFEVVAQTSGNLGNGVVSRLGIYTFEMMRNEYAAMTNGVYGARFPTEIYTRGCH